MGETETAMDCDTVAVAVADLLVSAALVAITV